MVVGSVHLVETFEFFHTLRRNNWEGVWQLDQFPFREDSVTAAKDAIRFLKALHRALDALDEDALAAHFVAAAAAAAPLPFFIYAFAARSGYPVPVDVVSRVREAAPNLVGLKVSESPLERVQPYLALDLPVLVGSEPLIPPAVARGAAGSVSGLAAAFPDVVREALDRPDATAEGRLTALRSAMEAQPFIASAKHLLARRGVPVRPDMRAPMRPLTPGEASALDSRLAELSLPAGAATG
jgi:dihydrodipicolinate synthase/N-acetylneuraminate lyase